MIAQRLALPAAPVRSRSRRTREKVRYDKAVSTAGKITLSVQAAAPLAGAAEQKQKQQQQHNQLEKENERIAAENKAALEKMARMQAEIAELTEKNEAMSRAHDNAQREHLAETQKLANMLRGQEDESSAEVEKLKTMLGDSGTVGKKKGGGVNSSPSLCCNVKKTSPISTYRAGYQRLFQAKRGHAEGFRCAYCTARAAPNPAGDVAIRPDQGTS